VRGQEGKKRGKKEKSNSRTCFRPQHHPLKSLQEKSRGHKVIGSHSTPPITNEQPFKDYPVQPPALMIHPALLKFIGLCGDLGNKISFYLQIDRFIFISFNRVTPPECPSHFTNQRLGKRKNMYIESVLYIDYFFPFPVNLELFSLICYYILIIIINCL